MKPKFKPTFTKAEIDRFVKGKLERVQHALLLMLQKVGEDFVTNARHMGAYKDQTGNLRSSVGYVIMKDGKQFSKGGFVKIKANKSSSGKLVKTIAGPKAGEALVETIKRENEARFSKGFVLIAVAGMDYAAAVESKGRDVITGSSQIAEKQLKESIERIRAKVFKAA